MSDRNRKAKSRILWVLTLGIGALLAFSLAHQCLGTFTPPKAIPPEAKSDFALMAEAWNTIQKYYVDRAAVKPRTLTYGAIGGMVDALGDTGHSAFLTPEMIKEERDFTRGRYKGIGAEVKMKDGHVVIVAPIDDSPAQRAGLRPGEIILKVDGKDIAGLPLIEVVKRISGPAGTRVTLTILNPETASTGDVTLTRAAITVHNVRWQRLPNTGIAQLRIAGFSEGVSKDLGKALKEIREKKMRGIILDLRDDPGGLLGEAVNSASQFLSGGNVLLEKNVRGEVTPVPVKSGGEAADVPLVVLVNGGTASAAEIVAGALQDAGRAKVVGEKTFGTGTVLQEFPLSDGSALLLAVQEWLTPRGHTIWHQGITPDIVVSLPQGVSPMFPEAEKGMTAAELKAGGDRQLLTALGLLTGNQP
jgi:carboxyl-terminal processing protease